jgi:peptidyl-dipeptidase A
MRPLYAEQVSLINRGAQQVGFKDVGELWRSQYDMSPELFEAQMEQLWSQVEPLYQALHCHVRAALHQKYGAERVPLDQAIPAHLTGNMWAQDWSKLYSLVAPFPRRDSLDVTSALRAKGFTPKSLTRFAERFFTSLGLDPLPDTFWTRSLFEKPSDREVVCHASAWDVEFNNDLRLKMCVKIDHEDLITLHHELGHHYYFQSYYTLPILLQEGANDGFHEGIGDTLALSVTPSYLHSAGVLPEASEHPEAVLNEQMRMGLEKLSFLPFGLLVDMWRWRVFKGDVPAEGYNELWWSLRERFQGVRPPHARAPEDFDPGAKYHVPGNTPYMRYFIAHILQFQLHRALCERSGHKGPLYTCSIYGSREAGAALRELLALGASKPWPEALKVVTGTEELDASAIIDYFAPLKAYLDEQNQGRRCGW